MDEGEKVRENRLRRAASRQELRLIKSRRRDPRAYDYGQFWLVDVHTTGTLVGPVSLDEIEDWLLGNDEATTASDQEVSR